VFEVVSDVRLESSVRVPSQERRRPYYLFEKRLESFGLSLGVDSDVQPYLSTLRLEFVSVSVEQVR
jgi:hypothetical protein